MSILSQLLDGKITFSQAVAQGEQWFSTLLAKAPTGVQQDVAAGLSNFKQAASNAVALADTAMGGIISVGSIAVADAANIAITKIVGPANATELTPGVDATITQAANALKAEIDAVAAQIRAAIVGTPAVPVPSPTPPTTGA